MMNILSHANTWLNQTVFFLPLMVAVMLATTGRVFAEGSKADSNSMTAVMVVQNTVLRVLTRIDAEKNGDRDDSQPLSTLVSEIVIPHLDMPRIARMALGKAWRKADEKQQQRFTEQFETLLVRTYAVSLQNFRAQNIQFPTKARPHKNGKASVVIGIQQSNNAVVTLEFRMHNMRGPWLVYDVKIEGISLIANYRTEFGEIVRNQGLETLIGLLKNKNEEAKLASIAP